MKEEKDFEIKQLRFQFKNKFGKIPEIRYSYCGSYGYQYCIYKTPSFTMGVIPYYTMGDTLSFATWYIDNLKMIPSAIVVFDTEAERLLWNRQEFVRLAQIEMDSLFADKFDVEEIQNV